MKHRRLVTGLLAAGAALLLVASAGTAEEALSPAQREAVEKLVHDYLLEHPEVIVESLEAMESLAQSAARAAQTEAIREHADALLNDPTAPVAGNPEGDLTVVEFFDYQCPYCKSVAQDFLATVEADGNVRIAFKEFPILGPLSEYAAKAALAAVAQGKYLDLHMALMTYKGKLSEETVLALARQVGLDAERLLSDMQAPELAEAIERNRRLAEQLRITGTPAFVVGRQLIPGAVGMDEMKAVIEKERRG